MKKFPISVTLYSTSKGHHNQDTYAHTIKHLAAKLPLDSFGSLNVHIKVSEGHGEKAMGMIEDLHKSGFFTYVTQGDWNREGNNHAEAYYKDMLTLMSQDTVHQNEYILFLEDDWLINCDNLAFWLSEGIKCLKNNKDILCVRVNDEINQDVSKATTINKYIYVQNRDAGRWGPTLTFQPTLMRTRDWYCAVRQINRDWELIKNQHCELLSGFYMSRLFSNSPTPFAFFDPSKINATHIGIPNLQEKLKNGNE